jgi:putative component of membrane protein insertase Oxa1/YidC/SpoIIIJ protein YidD
VKTPLLLAIKSYWFFIPEHRRNKCLYKTSCSRLVFSKTKEHGFVTGLKTLTHRLKHCRPGYHIIAIAGEPAVVTKGGEVILNNQLNLNILK